MELELFSVQHKSMQTLGFQKLSSYCLAGRHRTAPTRVDVTYKAKLSIYLNACLRKHNSFSLPSPLHTHTCIHIADCIRQLTHKILNLCLRLVLRDLREIRLIMKDILHYQHVPEAILVIGRATSSKGCDGGSSVVSNNFFHGNIYQTVLINYFFLQCLGSVLSSLSWCFLFFFKSCGTERDKSYS